MVDLDLSTLADVPGWTVDGLVATYRPTPDGWMARVRLAILPGRAYERVHVAIVDPDGTARHAMIVTTVGEARRVAEAQVRGRNASGGQPNG